MNALASITFQPRVLRHLHDSQPRVLVAIQHCSEKLFAPCGDPVPDELAEAELRALLLLRYRSPI